MKPKKKHNRIRYSYKDSKEGFRLNNVKCPICGCPINWTKVVEETSWAGKVKLLAECWSGEVHNEKPRHLFIIELNNLPTVNISEI